MGTHTHTHTEIHTHTHTHAEKERERERKREERQEITPTEFDELCRLLVTVKSAPSQPKLVLLDFSVGLGGIFFGPRNASEAVKKTCDETAGSDNQTSLY